MCVVVQFTLKKSNLVKDHLQSDNFSNVLNLLWVNFNSHRNIQNLGFFRNHYEIVSCKFHQILKYSPKISNNIFISPWSDSSPFFISTNTKPSCAHLGWDLSTLRSKPHPIINFVKKKMWTCNANKKLYSYRGLNELLQRIELLRCVPKINYDLKNKWKKSKTNLEFVGVS
jgi:hypothetical protein